MKFDVVVGNPPYQGPSEGVITGAKPPLYPQFITKALTLTNIYMLMITPHSWLFKSKLSSYKNFILDESGLKLLKKFKDSDDIFGKDIVIKGGISYFLCQKGYTGDIEYLAGNTNLLVNLSQIRTTRFLGRLLPSILNKVSLKRLNSIENKININGSIKSNDKRLTDDHSGILIHCARNTKKYISNKYMHSLKDFGYYKILLPNACSANFILNKIIIADKTHSSNQSKIHILCDSQVECQNMVSFLTTVPITFLTCLTQESHLLIPSTFNLVPEVDLSTAWDNAKTQQYFNLTDDEMAYMESCIKDFNIDKE